MHAGPFAYRYWGIENWPACLACRSLRLIRAQRRDARVNLMRKGEFNGKTNRHASPRVIPRRLFGSDSANILAMFKDTHGSPFSRRTRDIRSSKTSSAIYEPGLTATIYFANLSLFITRRHSRNPCARNAFPFVRQPFSYFRAAAFSVSDIAREISIILRNCRSHRAIAQNLKRHSHIFSIFSASAVQRILAELRERPKISYTCTRVRVYQPFASCRTNEKIKMQICTVALYRVSVIFHKYLFDVLSVYKNPLRIPDRIHVPPTVQHSGKQAYW